MYQAESSGAVLRKRPAVAGVGQRGPRVSRNVVVLGTVSLLTDVSSEMVAAILPIYLVFALGASPVQFGIVDGIYQGVSALVRLASGFLADRWRRHKEVAAVGYGLSAACKAGLVAIGGSVAAIGGIVFVDRTGKGIRTAPRDALIAMSSAPAALATAFGVHRAMDTAGAMLGPLVAFGLLLIAPARFDAIFVVSLCFAVLGLAVLLLCADGRPLRPASPPEAPMSDLHRGDSTIRQRVDEADRDAVRDDAVRPTVREAIALLAEPRFRTLVVAAGVLAVATVSDGFVYLGLQRTLGFSLTSFPLLFVGTAAVYMTLAFPVGRLADRIGRRLVFVGGYALLLPVYGVLLLPSAGISALVFALVALGAYYAATDGVLQAMASAVLPDQLRASGLALLVTATSLAKLVSSIAFGLVWTLGGLEFAAAAFTAALVAALLTATVVLRRSPEVAS
jgi:MFS family permease